MILDKFIVLFIRCGEVTSWKCILLFATGTFDYSVKTSGACLLRKWKNLFIRDIKFFNFGFWLLVLTSVLFDILFFLLTYIPWNLGTFVFHLYWNFLRSCVNLLKELHEVKRKSEALQMQQFVGEEKNDLLDYLRSLQPEKVCWFFHSNQTLVVNLRSSTWCVQCNLSGYNN